MINLLLKVPIGTSIALSDNPSVNEQAIFDAVQSIGAEFVFAGKNSADSLYVVITRTNDLDGIQGLIDSFSLPWVILHSQDAQATITMDESSVVVVHKRTPTHDYLSYMPDTHTYDDNGNVITTSTATEVTLPIYAGHEPFTL